MNVQRMCRVRGGIIGFAVAGFFLSTVNLPFAQAQTPSVGSAYPHKSVRVLVGFTAGGSTDMVARLVSQHLADKFKQPFVVENKAGAGGNIATEAAIRSAPDGYTLVVASVGPITVNPSLYGKLPYNPLTDLVPVIQVVDVPNVLVVHPSVPAKTMDEFVAYAKANPRKLNYGSTGVGTSSHLSSFMLSRRVGFEAVHVPYRGADALQDLLAGRIQMMFATIPSVLPHIKAGKLRAIAVSSPKRSRSMPDMPTVAETGFPGFEAGSWFGFFAPKGTPDAIVAQLNTAVNEVLQINGIDQQLTVQGADPIGGSSAQFAQFIQREYEKWKVVVRESGAKAE